MRKHWRSGHQVELLPILASIGLVIGLNALLVEDYRAKGTIHWGLLKYGTLLVDLGFVLIFILLIVLFLVDRVRTMRRNRNG